MRAELHKSLVYLDREYIADFYEVATGQSPDTTITSNQGKKAGTAIPVFSAEVSAQETRSFKISTLGMLAHGWSALAAEPDLDSNKFSPEMRSQYGWFNGQLTVYQAKLSARRPDGTNDVMAESEHFQIQQSQTSSLSLITTPEYFLSGLGTLVKLQKTALKEMSIPVRAFVRVFAAQDHMKQWVAIPLVMLERESHDFVTSPPSQAPATPSPAARSLWQDRWLLGALLLLLALYVYLLQLRPGGEGFGRGWNMIAFLFYGSPPAVAAGAIALWRVGKTAGLLQRVAILGATLGLSFPIVTILLMRLRT